MHIIVLTKDIFKTMVSCDPRVMVVSDPFVIKITFITTDINLPALPPPPKNVTPSVLRKNPFNRTDSTSSEETNPELVQSDRYECSETHQHDDTELLIDKGNTGSIYAN